MKDIFEQRRRFLFLQGSASGFFGQLGGALQARGHAVHRINFNGGDVVFWPLPGAVNYAGDLEGWAEFLADHLSKWNITDIILLSDCRPLHQVAIKVAVALHIPTYVFEEGYMRPNWITLERGGVNAYSSLGRDPQWFLDAARDLPSWQEPKVAVNSMVRRSVEDILYVFATSLMSRRFPGYRSHRPWSSWIEYAGGARRFFLKPSAKRRLAETLDGLASADRPYYLFPLQHEADSQIRLHSNFGGVKPTIEFVIKSFAKFAPADSMLLITEHPLDTSPFDWREVTTALAAEQGVEDRVCFYEGGSTDRAIHGCRGVVTVNSTLGYLALSFGKPLIALGAAIYGIRDLTFQGGLDKFWTEAVPPNPEIFDAFRRVVATLTQVNGSFFSDAGLKLAVEGSVARLEADFASPRSAPAVLLGWSAAPDESQGATFEPSLEDWRRRGLPSH